LQKQIVNVKQGQDEKKKISRELGAGLGKQRKRSYFSEGGGGEVERQTASQE